MTSLGPEENEKIVSYRNTCIKEDDLSLLNGSNWLNDKLIDFAFEYMTDTVMTDDMKTNILLCCAEITQLMKVYSAQELAPLVEALSLGTQKWIFCPVNDCTSLESLGGSHWSLLVYEAGAQRFHYFDTLDVSNLRSAALVIRQLCHQLNVPEDTDVVCRRSPHQQNGHDCGMYVIEMTRMLLEQIKSRGHIEDDSVCSLTAKEIELSRGTWRDILMKLAAQNPDGDGGLR